MLHDLTQPITAGMPVYPGDPAVAFQNVATVADDGAAITHLQLGSHTGTHLDAPAHIVDGGTTVEELDLNLLHGPAHILQVHRAGSTQLAGQPLGLNDVVDLPKVLPNIVCLATGWDQYFNQPQRLHHPYLSIELANALWQRGARVLGVDTLSPDSSAPTVTLPVHKFWLAHDGVIVENLRDLTALPQRVELSMLPLPLAGVDGSPVRAVARY